MLFNTTDDELMAKVARGDQAAFRSLFERHASRVLGYCCRFLGNRQGAEDVTQEVWLKVVRASPGYRPEGKFTAWLMTVTRTSCLSAARSRRGDEEVAFEEGAESDIPDVERETAEERMKRGQSIAELKSKIEALPNGQRMVLTMWMAEDLSYEEIGRELKISVSSVKSLLFRARQNLEKSIRIGS